jgi:putative ABC transport system substrate-binding protein
MNGRMHRREAMALFGGMVAASVVPLAAHAQTRALPVIGFLGSEAPGLFSTRLRAFREGLSELGYVEGRNVTTEYRWAEGHYDRLPALAVELVRRKVDVIVAPGGTPAPLAAKAATSTIPIVFQSGADPVQFGLVASLNRPGGNVTGVTSLNVEVGQKRLELLRELIPRASLVGMLVNPANPNAATLQRDVQSAARILGLRIEVLRTSDESDFDAIFATLTRSRAGGLVIGTDTFFTARSEALAALSIRHALPTVYQYREFAAAGGLMSYGASLTDQYRLVGVYTGRVLKGDRPADLPVQQSTRIELINIKSAKALGLTFPLTLLGRADEVIE